MTSKQALRYWEIASNADAVALAYPPRSPGRVIWLDLGRAARALGNDLDQRSFRS